MIVCLRTSHLICARRNIVTVATVLNYSQLLHSIGIKTDGFFHWSLKKTPATFLIASFVDEKFAFFFCWQLLCGL